jgi:nucleoside 2-deoxyribosyltransferase
MAEALAGHAAQHVFNFDKAFLNVCRAGVLLMPAGKSGHLEAGYLVGQGKPVFGLFEEDPERFDVMLNFLTAVTYNVEDLIKCLANLLSGLSPPINPGLQYYKGNSRPKETSVSLSNSREPLL